MLAGREDTEYRRFLDSYGVKNTVVIYLFVEPLRDNLEARNSYLVYPKLPIATRALPNLLQLPPEPSRGDSIRRGEYQRLGICGAIRAFL